MERKAALMAAFLFCKASPSPCEQQPSSVEIVAQGAFT
jgi:hypothetical protein